MKANDVAQNRPLRSLHLVLRTPSGACQKTRPCI